MTKKYDPPFQPVATRKSAAAAAPTTNQSYPGLRTPVGTIRQTDTRDSIPSTKRRRTASDETIEEDQEYAYAYADSPRRGKTTQRVYTPVMQTRRLPKTRFHPLVFVGF